MNSMNRTIFKYFCQNFLGKLIILSSSFVMIPILIDILGTKIFAEIGFLFTFIQIYNLFDLGITKSLIREIAINFDILKNKKNELSRIYISCICFQFSFAFIISSLIIFVFKYLNISEQFYSFNNESLIQYLIIIISLSTLACAGIGRAFFEGNSIFIEPNFVRSLNSFLIFIFPLITYKIFNKPDLILISVLIGKALESLLINFLAIKRFQINLLIKPSIKSLRNILHIGIPMMFYNMSLILVEFTEKLTIVSILGLTLYTPFYLANEVNSKIFILVSTLSISTFAMESRLSFVKEKNAKLNKLPLLIMFIYASFAIFINRESYFLVDFWLNDVDTNLIAKIIKTFSIALVPLSLSINAINKIQAVGKSSLLTLQNLINTLIYIPLLILTNNKYGIMGLAYLYVIKKYFDTFVILFIAKKYLDKNYLRRTFIQIFNVLIYTLTSITIFKLIQIDQLSFQLRYLLFIVIFGILFKLIINPIYQRKFN